MQTIIIIIQRVFIIAMSVSIYYNLIVLCSQFPNVTTSIVILTIFQITLQIVRTKNRSDNVETQ